jgi:putative transposase
MVGELFDPHAELLIHHRLRPHWSQAGAIVFITFRTKDSIPADVVSRWDRDKQEWVERALAQSSGTLSIPTSPVHVSTETIANTPGMDQRVIHDGTHWSTLIRLLTEERRHEFTVYFNHCRETKLDECHGECLLKHPDLAQIVHDSLLYFDGVRYRMGDFVVMPNHVHLLASFPTQQMMEGHSASWLRYTSRAINQRLGRTGQFWQQEPFDHLVRSVEQYAYLRNYIARNPEKAGLKPGEYLYRRYPG